MESLAQLISSLTPPQQSQIPQASPEFLASGQNPNIRNFPPGRQPQFVHPVLQQLYNAPGQIATGAGNALSGGMSSLANFIGMQMVKPEMTIRDNVNDNFITRRQAATDTAIQNQSK